MDRWPALVENAAETLRLSTSAAQETTLGNPVYQFAYDAISHLWTSIGKAKADKIRSNFLVASMFVKYLMDGQLDLPQTVDAFYETVCGPSGVPGHWSREALVIQRLRLPLQISLAISPLCLLLPVRLAVQDVSREKLLTVRPTSRTFCAVYLTHRLALGLAATRKSAARLAPRRREHGLEILVFSGVWRIPAGRAAWGLRNCSRLYRPNV
jgi:hypothetical protein